MTYGAASAPPWTDEEVVELQRLWNDEKMPMRTIAKLKGYVPSTMMGRISVLREKGVRFDDRNRDNAYWTRERTKRLYVLYCMDKYTAGSVSACAEAFDIAEDMIVDRLAFMKRHNWRFDDASVIARRGKIHAKHVRDEGVVAAVKVLARRPVLEAGHELTWGCLNDLIPNVGSFEFQVMTPR